MYSGIFTFLVDAYPTYAASALAANSFTRSTFGAVFPLFGIQSTSSASIVCIRSANVASVQRTGIPLGDVSPGLPDTVHVTVPVSPLILHAFPASTPLLRVTGRSELGPFECWILGGRMHANGRRYIFFRYGSRIRQKSRFATSGF